MENNIYPIKYTVGEEKERRLIYSNDFKTAKEYDEIIKLWGSLEVCDGALRCSKDLTQGHSTVLVNVENLTDFVVEVDFLKHQGGGGIIFQCDGDRARKAVGGEEKLNGYMAYIGNGGDTGAIGCFVPACKWSGNFSVSLPDRIKVGTDLRLYVRVSGDFIIYIVYDIATGEEVYRYEYTKSDSRYDTSPYDTGKIALRLNNDGGIGGFSNLKIYEMKKPVMSKEAHLAVNEKLDTVIRGGISEEMIVFTDKNGIGHAVTYDATAERFLLYRYNDGEVLYTAEHAMMLTKGKEYALSVANSGNMLRFYVEDMRYPVFEAKTAGEIDFYIGSTAELELSVSEYSDTYTGKTYTNPVAHGADPEILYHDGCYYMYNLDKKQEPNRVRVRVSKDLSDWDEAGYCFIPDENTPIQTFMSPNVFYHDGLFYLLIASHVGGTGSHEYYVFYAHSTSPTGPFIMNTDPPYVNAHQEIGGAPFIDDDGRIYLTSVRFGGGNHVYVQEVKAKDGVITPVGEAVHCASPTEHYEIDEYGRISEGGVITKHNGYYYMMYASGHFRGHYGEAYVVSDNIFGPYKKYKYNNPLHHTEYVDGAGDCMFVPTPDGKDLFVVYHRHTVTGNKGYDRSVCVDRVYFVPSEDGGPDVLRIYGPTITPQPVPEFAQKK